MSGPIISVSLDVQDNSTVYEDLVRRLTDPATHVDIGIHAVSGEEMVMIASVNEFGAEIEHPGGTSYGYETEAKAEAGKVRFLEKGQGFMEIGVTGPHEIVIPARPFIRSTMDERRERYGADATRLWNQILEGRQTLRGGLALLGQLVERDIRMKIRTLRTPPNAPSTIAKKGSDNPLIDTGAMRGSVRYAVKTDKEQVLEMSPAAAAASKPKGS